MGWSTVDKQVPPRARPLLRPGYAVDTECFLVTRTHLFGPECRYHYHRHKCLATLPVFARSLFGRAVFSWRLTSEDTIGWGFIIATANSTCWKTHNNKMKEIRPKYQSCGNVERPFTEPPRQHQCCCQREWPCLDQIESVQSPPPSNSMDAHEPACCRNRCFFFRLSSCCSAVSYRIIIVMSA